MYTHYAHVLATAGVVEPYGQVYASLLGFSCKAEDITAVSGQDYMLAPGVLLVRVDADEATLDAIAAAPGNVELFREAL